MQCFLKPRRLLTLAAALLGLALLWGIGTAFAASASPSPNAKVVLKLGWLSDPDNLNPFVGYATSSFEVWSLNYDPLVELNPKDMKPSNRGLAESWQLSADKKTWTFHLHKGVKWQDGQPCTAEDVAWTYDYIIDNNMYTFTGATAGIKTVVAVDPLTVKVICNRPKADMLYLYIPILPKHIWQHVKPSVAGNTYLNKPPIVGTGPFQTVEVKKNDYVRMVANGQYFLGRPHIDEIVFETYQDASTMSDDFKAGTIDAAQGLLQAQFETLRHVSGIKAVAYNYRSWSYLALNCYTGRASTGNPVLRDVRFRQALNWAIDKKKIASIAYGGFASPGATILPPGEWVNPDFHWEPPAASAYRFDPAEASRLLTGAGYALKNGVRVDKQGRPITLRLWTTSDSMQAQTAIRFVTADLRHIGLRIRLAVLDSNALSTRIWNFHGATYAPDFDMEIWSYDGYTDPGQTLNSFASNEIGVNGYNEPCWSNAEYDRLCGAQATTIDPQQRQRIIWRMQQIMYEQSPEIVLCYPQVFQAFNTAHWTGWTQVLNGKGAAFYLAQPDTYLNVRQLTGASSRSSSTLWIAFVAAAAVIAVALVAWLLRRGAARRVEE